MKHNKLFAILAMSAALVLGACNGGTSSSKAGSSGKGSSGGKVSSSQQPSTSKAPTKNAAIDEIKLLKKNDNKVYVQFNGSETLYTSADSLKYAIGISTDSSIPEAGEDGTISSENFIYGHAVPTAEDFKAITFTPAADATAVKFSLEVCLTDIVGIKTGVYNLFGGFSAEDYDVLEFVDDNAEFMARDSKYDYFMRTDGNPNGLAIEDLGPVVFNAAKVEKNPDAEHEGLWLKASGVKNAGYTGEITQTVVDAWNTKLDFQRMNGYSKTSNTQFFWKVDGTAISLYISVAQLVSDLSASNPTRRYMTHLTADAPNPAPRGFNPGKLLPSVDILTNNVYSFADENVKFTVIGDTSKGQNDGEDHFYGALGVQVEYIVAPEAPADGE